MFAVQLAGRLGAILALGACDRLFSLTEIPEQPAADVGVDTAAFGPWSPAQVVEDVLPAGADDPSFTDDELELYIDLGQDIQVRTRATTSSPWSLPMIVDELSSGGNDSAAKVSGDGLLLYLSSNRLGTEDLYVSTRTDRSSAWAPAGLIAELSTNATEGGPTGTPDGLVIAFMRVVDNNEVYESQRDDTTDAWRPPVPLQALNTPVREGGPTITADGLTIVFISNRDGDDDLFTSTRASRTAPFDPPQRIDVLSTTGAGETDPFISGDGRTLYFRRGTSLLRSTR